MRKIILTILMLTAFYSAYSQQFSLYNTRTLYDASENPSQKAFQADSSKKFAFNVFIPTLGFNAAITGQGQQMLRSSIFTGVSNPTNLELGANRVNRFLIHSNSYLLQFRIFKTEKYNTEMGFSWQLRSDANVKVTNETLALFTSYKLFKDTPPSDLFNNSGYNQSYHQFSFTYREDYDRRLSLGVKLSLLSGMTYHNLKINSSALTINNINHTLEAGLNGRFRSSFKIGNFDARAILPLFQNPGFAASLSGSYKFKNGIFMLANLKDLGFIIWNRKSYEYNFNSTLRADSIDMKKTGPELKDGFDKLMDETGKQRSFTTLTNGKAEVLFSKKFGAYHPNLIISKNIIDREGDLALINNYTYRKWIYSVSADYNFYNFFQLGLQVMHKTPNLEYFIGTDQLSKTFQTAKGIITRADAGTGYTGASIYLGFAVKFGPDVEHPQNANSIPGFKGQDENSVSFFRSLMFWKRR